MNVIFVVIIFHYIDNSFKGWIWVTSNWYCFILGIILLFDFTFHEYLRITRHFRSSVHRLFAKAIYHADSLQGSFRKKYFEIHLPAIGGSLLDTFFTNISPKWLLAHISISPVLFSFMPNIVLLYIILSATYKAHLE